MAKKTTASTAEDKLRALYDLQLIDSRIDRIRVVRGELPLEVEDLEDEIAGLRARLELAVCKTLARHTGASPPTSLYH